MSQLRWLLRYDADRRIVLIVYCRALGFDLFQRYLLSHPSTVKSHALVPSPGLLAYKPGTRDELRVSTTSVA